MASNIQFKDRLITAETLEHVLAAVVKKDDDGNAWVTEIVNEIVHPSADVVVADTTIDSWITTGSGKKICYVIPQTDMPEARDYTKEEFIAASNVEPGALYNIELYTGDELYYTMENIEMVDTEDPEEGYILFRATEESRTFSFEGYLTYESGSYAMYQGNFSTEVYPDADIITRIKIIKHAAAPNYVTRDAEGEAWVRSIFTDADEEEY